MSEICKYILKRLNELADPLYKDFHTKLIPGFPYERILGVRTPDIKKLASELYKRDDIGEFLTVLPHKYYDEMNLHSFIIQKYKNFGDTVKAVEAFIPYIDNWATCDSLSPAAFAKHKDELMPYILNWLSSDHLYTVRFALGCLMKYFLDEKFKPEYIELAASVRSEEYYINMMIAWYFATALAKQYESALPYLTYRKLPEWVHNKAIQKAIESNRITPETKKYLKTLKIR